MSRRRKSGNLVMYALVGAAGVAAGYYLANWMANNAQSNSQTTNGLGLAPWQRRWLRRHSGGGGGGGGGSSTQNDPWGALFQPQQGTATAYDTTPEDDQGYD